MPDTMFPVSSMDEREIVRMIGARKRTMPARRGWRCPSAEQAAAYLDQRLAGDDKAHFRTSQSKTRPSLPTPLTQQHRREAKGRPPFPAVEVPRPDRVCRGCGKQIRSATHFCADCAATITRKNFDLGRKAAQRPESLAKRSATQRMHKQAIQNWKPSDLPNWLTRDVYVERVQPELVHVAKSQIRSALGVSEPYSSAIQAGKRVPHPRHWQALAELIKLSHS